MSVTENVTRRGFVAGAAGLAAAGMVAGATSAIAKEEAATTEAAAQPAFLTKPEVPTEIAEERDCDVLVIGMGLAGPAAFKAAWASKRSR